MKELTERQKEVLAFIEEYIREHNYSPIIRDIAEHFSMSVKGAHDHIRAIERKGALKQENGKSRTLEVTASGKQVCENLFPKIPILGVVAAGWPIFSEENLEGYLQLHHSFLTKGQNYFALRVQGDSMTGAGILDGDLAVIEQQPTVRNGQIAVVMLEDAVTLKTFYRERSRVRLQPENPKYEPIYATGDIRILGRLFQVIRSYG